MKKYIILLAAFAIALLSCNKQNTEISVTDANSNIPAWVTDESLPVPVIFSQGDLFQAQTKSGLITSTDFTDASFLYGVTALDLDDTDVRLFHTDDNHVEAVNTTSTDLASGKYLAEFGSFVNSVWTPVTYYYPLQSANNFTFFGYRTNDDDNFAISWSEGNAFVNNVEIGHEDVIWAKGEAPALTPSPGVNVTGFNAKYIRKAWEYVDNDAEQFYADWAPKLHFNHILTAFQFVIKTDAGRGYDASSSDPDVLAKKDDAAKKFVEADIYVTEMVVSGLHAAANLKVTASTVDIADIDPTLLLESVGTKTDITVQNVVNPTLPWAPDAPVASGDYFFPQYNDGAGNDYGEALLVLPTAVEELASDYDSADPNPTATIKFHVPNQDDTEDIVLELKQPSGGFLAGKRYVFTILVHSPEEIEVVTSLADWVDADHYEDLDIEIE